MYLVLFSLFYTQTATPNTVHQFSELVDYEIEVAEEVELYQVFQQFISRYQEIYEQESTDKQDNDNDTGTNCITDY